MMLNKLFIHLIFTIEHIYSSMYFIIRSVFNPNPLRDYYLENITTNEDEILFLKANDLLLHKGYSEVEITYSNGVKSTLVIDRYYDKKKIKI